jgi:heavy metal sensor kinase
MTLRKRLTLIYTLLVGGILLFWGAIVYQLVSVSLIYQVDRQLANAAQTAIESIPNTTDGSLTPESLKEADFEYNFFYQFWSRDKQLLRASSNLPENIPLAVAGFGYEKPRFFENQLGNVSMRVLSVPLVIGQRPVGTLQVATSMSLVDLIQRSLLTVLIWGAITAILIIGLAVWLSTKRALAPLENVSQTARQITRTGDLTRRISYQGYPEDEVGQLIQAFNQTLERLEILFNSQQRFIADVSHDLRTPLTVIKGNVDLIRRLGCKEEEIFDSIDVEVKRLTRMVEDLLLIAQAETGRLPLDKQDLALDTLLLEVLDQAYVLAEGKLDLQLIEIDQVMICGDHDRIKQAILNLISNAIKYTPPGGAVRISLEKKQGQAVISVEDTGPGIPEEDLPHIFERFYRVEKSRTRGEDAGFGLGLSIAYWIINRHQGEIEVETEMGEGSIFRVILPLAENGC